MFGYGGGDPPELPQELAGPIDPAVAMKTNFTQIALSSRPVGVRAVLRIAEATPGGLVKAGAELEWARLVKEVTYGEEESSIAVPAIFSQRSKSVLVCRDGHPALVAAMPAMPGDPGTGLEAAATYLFVFARASVRPLETMNPPRTSSFVIAATAVLVSLAAAASSALADDEKQGCRRRSSRCGSDCIEADHALIRRWALDPQNDWDAAAMRATPCASKSPPERRRSSTSRGSSPTPRISAPKPSRSRSISSVQFDPPEVPQELARTDRSGGGHRGAGDAHGDGYAQAWSDHGDRSDLVTGAPGGRVNHGARVD
ncbi:MAG: hypothetical protein R3F11_19885 [Verrucomicrobiales bacterium]